MSTTGRCCAEKVDSCTCAVLSSLAREKSGAGSPGCKVPERARIHRVSKGKSRNGTGPGSLAMNPAKASGGRSMMRYRAPQPSTKSTARRMQVAITVLITAGLVANCLIAVSLLAVIRRVGRTVVDELYGSTGWYFHSGKIVAADRPWVVPSHDPAFRLRR